MGRGHAEQVPRRVDPPRNGPLCLAPPSDEALAVAAGTVPGVWPGAARVQSGARLECRPWLGVVSLPGGPRGRELDAPARLPLGGNSGSGGVSVPVDLGIADRHLDRGMPELADDRLGSRAALALPGGRSPGRLHRRGVFSPGLAALGLDRARVALSDPGEQVGGDDSKNAPSRLAGCLPPAPAFPW